MYVQRGMIASESIKAMTLIGWNGCQRDECMAHIFPCTPQGGNISRLYPT